MVVFEDADITDYLDDAGDDDSGDTAADDDDCQERQPPLDDGDDSAGAPSDDDADGGAAEPADGSVTHATDEAGTDPATVEPARPTYAWGSDYVCRDCGAAIERGWRRDGDDGFVCETCKQW